WYGELGELGIGLDDKLLQRDYFPHGGIIGAGFIHLPKVLVDGPRVDLLARMADETKSPLDRLTAALTFVQECILALTPCGSLGFYLPAPTPPLVFAVEGEVAARALIESLTALQVPGEGLLDDVQVDGHRLIRTELAFLRGVLTARLLGLPIAEATIRAQPG